MEEEILDNKDNIISIITDVIEIKDGNREDDNDDEDGEEIDEEDKLEKEYIENELKESLIAPLIEQKGEEVKKFKPNNLIFEMRGLLKSYPLNINFKNNNDIFSVVNNFFIIYDLLDYCSYRTTKDDVRELINKEISFLDENFKVNELRIIYKDILSDKIYFGKHNLYNKLHSLVDMNLNLIIRKINYFSLSLPIKGKPYMRLESAHGLPSDRAIEYESSEIEAGEKIQEGQKFQVGDEGQIIAL